MITVCPMPSKTRQESPVAELFASQCEEESREDNKTVTHSTNRDRRGGLLLVGKSTQSSNRYRTNYYCYQFDDWECRSATEAGPAPRTLRQRLDFCGLHRTMRFRQKSIATLKSGSWTGQRLRMILRICASSSNVINLRRVLFSLRSRTRRAGFALALPFRIPSARQRYSVTLSFYDRHLSRSVTIGYIAE
jgi:hypothetical protein